MAELGALSLRIETTGDRQALAALGAIDTKAQQAAGAEQKLTASQKALNREIAEGTRLFALQGRTVDHTSQTAVRELRQSAQAQGQWLTQVGASTTQQEQFGRSVQLFEGRVQKAEKAQAKQAATTTLFGREVAKADGQLSSFSRRGLSSLNVLAFGFSQFANTGEASLRSLAQATTGVLAFLGPKGAIASIIGTIALGTTDAVLGFMNAARERSRADQIAGAKAELTIVKGRLDAEAAAEEAAYQRGTKSLSAYYQTRATTIEAGRDAEIAARQQQIAALQIRLAKLPLERDRDREEADRSITQLRAEISALGSQASAQLAQNEAQGTAALRSLRTALDDFEQRRLTMQGRTHQARLLQIQQEADAMFRLPLTTGESLEDRRATVDAFVSLATNAANLDDRRVHLGRLQADLDLRRLGIQQQLTAGKISETDAAKQTADVERSSLSTLMETVDAAILFAAALGEEGALGELRRIKAELGDLGRANISGTTNAVQARLATQIAAISEQVRTGALSFEAGRQMAQDARFGAGLAEGLAATVGAGISAAFAGGNIAEAMEQTFSQVLGQVFTTVATNWIMGLKLMATIQAWAAANPLLALGAAAALLALGRALGGSGGGAGGGSGGGGGSLGSTSTLQSYVYGPNAASPLSAIDRQLRATVARLRAIVQPQPTVLGRQMATAGVATPAVGPSFGRPLVFNSPEGERLMTQAVRAYTRRGG
jgi:hypothetical protein